MRMEEITCCLENAKMLDELGVRGNESEYMYMVCGGMNYLRHRATTNINPCDTIYSAWTAAELGEMLPCGTKTWKAFDDAWSCQTIISTGAKITIGGYSMSEAMSNLLIWLRENGEIEASK